MNIVIRTAGAVQRRSPLGGIRLLLSPPVYLYPPLRVSFILALILTVWMGVVRRDLPASPFSTYSQILPGQPYSSASARDFSCDTYRKTGRREYCTYSPTNGSFSLISVIFTDEVVSRINFAVRENTLNAGDLILVWGRPNIQLYRQSIILEWPDIGISAMAWAKNGRFQYFTPVEHVSFTTLPSPR